MATKKKKKNTNKSAGAGTSHKKRKNTNSSTRMPAGNDQDPMARSKARTDPVSNILYIGC